ncbi:hypothetical protein F0342_00710 [Bacillus sp. CH30_1T]|nr:hypothetical protein F0342_00710 [Bacillus sp. CH30_1T]
MGTVLLFRCEQALGDGVCKGEQCGVSECMGLFGCEPFRRRKGGYASIFLRVSVSRDLSGYEVRYADIGHGECGGLIGRERGSGVELGEACWRFCCFVLTKRSTRTVPVLLWAVSGWMDAGGVSHGDRSLGSWFDDEKGEGLGCW